MRRIRSIAPLSLALTVLTFAAAAAAAPTTVDSLTANVSGSSIGVTGSVTFGGQDPVEVGLDGCGDAAGGAAATAIGLDHERLFISQPNPAVNSLLFTIRLCGMAGGGVPEGVQYNWDIMVNGGAGAGGTNWSIKTMRSRASATTNLNPYAATFTCVPSGTGFSCTQNTLLTAVYDETAREIRMTVPFAAIGGAGPGSRIEAWPRATNPFWIGPSASGALTLTNVFDTGSHDEYVIPTGSMVLGLVPAGTPESAVTYNYSAILSGSNYTGNVTAPGAGSYDVWVKACFGTNCGTRSTTVTVV